MVAQRRGVWRGADLGEAAQPAGRHADEVREARGKRAQAAIADLETDVRDAESRGQEEALGLLQTQRGQELTWRNAGDMAEHAGEVIRAQVCNVGHVMQGQIVVQPFPHGGKHTLNGEAMYCSGRGLATGPLQRLCDHIIPPLTKGAQARDCL